MVLQVLVFNDIRSGTLFLSHVTTPHLLGKPETSLALFFTGKSVRNTQLSPLEQAGNLWIIDLESQYIDGTPESL